MTRDELVAQYGHLIWERKKINMRLSQIEQKLTKCDTASPENKKELTDKE
jgi:hypothetical protein